MEKHCHELKPIYKEYTNAMRRLRWKRVLVFAVMSMPFLTLVALVNNIFVHIGSLVGFLLTNALAHEIFLQKREKIEHSLSKKVDRLARADVQRELDGGTDYEND